MPPDTLDLKTNRLFPFHFQLAGWAFLFTSLPAIFLMPLLGAGLFLSAILILTAYRGITFDRGGQSYRVYHAFLGFKSGKKAHYRHADYLYIHPIRTSQKVNTMVTSGITTRHKEYDAYLKVDDADRIYLMTHAKKEVLLDKLLPLADYLSLEIMDRTTKR